MSPWWLLVVGALCFLIGAGVGHYAGGKDAEAAKVRAHREGVKAGYADGVAYQKHVGRREEFPPPPTDDPEAFEPVEAEPRIALGIIASCLLLAPLVGAVIVRTLWGW